MFAAPVHPDGEVRLLNHSEIPSAFYSKVAGNRSPYDRDWVYWSARQGRYPTVSPRLATLLKRQKGRCAYCQLFFQHHDQLEIDHINGDRKNSRLTNLQALHGHCRYAKTRENREYLPRGMRDKYQNTEERSARKRARSVLEQR